MEPGKIRIALAALLAALTFMAADASAEGRPRGGWHGSGLFAAPPAAAHSGGFHHHGGHGTFFVGGAFFSPWPYAYYYYPPPYYYGPDYSRPQYEAPSVYVEKFEGAPTPETQGDIFCPSAGAYYPDVKDCPGGWQRVIR